jgi:septum formation protein
LQFPADFQLVLASQSPRRHSLLSDLGIPFTVAASEATELSSGRSVSSLAQDNALAKVFGARLPEGLGRGAFVLGTDTLVSLGRRIMGKPASAEEAREMLTALSGRRHRVVSGVALARAAGGSLQTPGSRVRVASAMTQVAFARLTKEQIEAYVASGEWRGKAGGYAVQGMAALFVRGLRGEYTSVVGLPLHLLYGLFSELGFDLVRRTWTESEDSR